MVTRTAYTVTVCTGRWWGKLPMLGVRAGAQPGCDGLHSTALVQQFSPTAGSGNKWRRPLVRGCQECWLQHRCQPQRRTPRCRGPASERCSPSASSQRHRTPSPSLQSPGARAPSRGTPAWQQGSRMRGPCPPASSYSHQACCLAPARACRHHPAQPQGSGSCSQSARGPAGSSRPHRHPVSWC